MELRKQLMTAAISFLKKTKDRLDSFHDGCILGKPEDAEFFEDYERSYNATNTSEAKSTEFDDILKRDNSEFLSNLVNRRMKKAS